MFVAPGGRGLLGDERSWGTRAPGGRGLLGDEGSWGTRAPGGRGLLGDEGSWGIEGSWGTRDLIIRLSQLGPVETVCGVSDHTGDVTSPTKKPSG